MGVPDKKVAMTFDWPLFIATLFLTIVGLINLASAAPSPSFWHRQLFNMVIGMGLLVVMAGIDYRIFERMAYIIYAATLILLFLTVLVGTYVSGSKSWIRIGSFSVQPSELVKIGAILALAKYYHNQRIGGPYGLKKLIAPALIAICPAVLIMLQPDLGTMVMLMFIVAGMILFVGVDRRLLIAGIALILVAAPLSWFIMAPHQKNRIIAFINPQADPNGIGYNVIQSMVAVGSGKLIGKGYKLGTQTALRYLPERHTDFVFSVLGEEWGFIGSILVVATFLFIIFWGVKISAGAKDRFGALVALGVVLMIFCHTVINVAMTLGSFPVVGIPLPFMSYGGTFLIAALTGVGLLMSIEGRRFMF